MLNKIILGDCLEVMKRIPDKSVDMVLCDLPYGTTACTWDTVIPFDPLWKQYGRLIKDGGRIVLFGTEPFSSFLRLSNIKNYRYDWVWYKNTQTGISLAKHQPMRSYEMISIFGNGPGIYNKQPTKHRTKDPIKSMKRKRSGKSEHYGMDFSEGTFQENINPRNVLEFDVVPNGNGAKLHPTQKPVALFEYLIRTYTNEGDTVLDNCIGSGTTAIACINTGRNFIGIEKEEKYCRIAEERIHALRSPAQNTMEICHTAPNSRVLQ